MSVNFSLEKRILHVLLMNSYHYSNLGLLSGKMGISLLFIHYYVNTKQLLFRDYAFGLIDKMRKEVNQNTPLGLDSGLAGIGWGIEYLLRNEFVKGKGVDICEAIDHKIMQNDPRRIKDLSLETGLEGLLHYILAHLQGAIIQNVSFPFDNIYLRDLYIAVCAIPSDKMNVQMKVLINKYVDFYKERDKFNYNVQLTSFVEKIEVDDDNICNLPLGLRRGLAGYLFESYVNL